MLLAMGCRCPSLLLSALLFGRSHFKNIRLFFHSIRNDHDALRIYRSRCMIDYEQCYVNTLGYVILFSINPPNETERSQHRHSAWHSILFCFASHLRCPMNLRQIYVQFYASIRRIVVDNVLCNHNDTDSKGIICKFLKSNSLKLPPLRTIVIHANVLSRNFRFFS